MSEVQNLERFNAIWHSTTPGKEGVKHDGDLFKEAKWANKNSADLLNRLTPGKAGVRHEGDLYGILRRTEYNTAVNTQLVSALKAVSGGQAFDEAKLLAGIEKAVKAGVAAGIDSIETTVTITDGK